MNRQLLRAEQFIEDFDRPFRWYEINVAQR